MIKLNLLRPKYRRPHWDIWFKYENPKTMIDRLGDDIRLITPRVRSVGYFDERLCLPMAESYGYIELHGEIYRV